MSVNGKRVGSKFVFKAIDFAGSKVALVAEDQYGNRIHILRVREDGSIQLASHVDTEKLGLKKPQFTHYGPDFAPKNGSPGTVRVATSTY